MCDKRILFLSHTAEKVLPLAGDLRNAGIESFTGKREGGETATDTTAQIDALLEKLDKEKGYGSPPHWSLSGQDYQPSPSSCWHEYWPMSTWILESYLPQKAEASPCHRHFKARL